METDPFLVPEMAPEMDPRICLILNRAGCHLGLRTGEGLEARECCRQWEPGFGLKTRLLKLRFAAPASISDTHEAALKLRFAAPASISDTDDAMMLR